MCMTLKPVQFPSKHQGLKAILQTKKKKKKEQTEKNVTEVLS